MLKIETFETLFKVIMATSADYLNNPTGMSELNELYG